MTQLNTKTEVFDGTFVRRAAYSLELDLNTSYH